MCLAEASSDLVLFLELVKKNLTDKPCARKQEQKKSTGCFGVCQDCWKEAVFTRLQLKYASGSLFDDLDLDVSEDKIGGLSAQARI